MCLATKFILFPVCNTTHVVSRHECICDCFYIGLTKRRLRDRVVEHRYSIQTRNLNFSNPPAFTFFFLSELLTLCKSTIGLRDTNSTPVILFFFCNICWKHVLFFQFTPKQLLLISNNVISTSTFSLSTYQSIYGSCCFTWQDTPKLRLWLVAFIDSVEMVYWHDLLAWLWLGKEK